MHWSDRYSAVGVVAAIFATGPHLHPKQGPQEVDQHQVLLPPALDLQVAALPPHPHPRGALALPVAHPPAAGLLPRPGLHSLVAMRCPQERLVAAPGLWCWAECRPCCAPTPESLQAQSALSSVV